MSKGWTGRALGYAPAIPALDALDGDTLGTQHGGGASLLSGLAASGYRLKNGAWTVLSAPVLAPGNLKAPLYYLHHCRVAALSGCLNANWMNANVLENRPDLLVWTRAHMQYSLLKQEAPLGIRFGNYRIKADELEDMLGNDIRIARTIVCQQKSDCLTALCEKLKSFTRPFAMVADFTPFGDRRDPIELLSHLDTYFHEVPLLLLVGTGDTQTELLLRQYPRRLDTWRQHPQDPVLLTRQQRLPWSATLAGAPDNKLDGLLYQAAQACRTLRDQLPTDHLKKVHCAALYKILSFLRDMMVPIDFFESQLENSRRGGLFPIKPIRDWLNTARSNLPPTGDAKEALERAAKTVEEVMALLASGRCGKQQSLDRWLGQGKAGKRRAVIVRTEQEAKILSAWLVREHGAELDAGVLAVIGVGSVREAYRKLKDGAYDHVLVPGWLWQSEGWAFYSGRQVTWLCYPSELARARQQGPWLMGAGQADERNKEAWWEYEPIGQFSIRPGEQLPEEEWGDCSGTYHLKKSVEITLPDDPDWLASLMADMEEPDGEDETARVTSPGDIRVMTLESDTPYDFHEDQAVHVLMGEDGSDTLEVIEAQQLEPGHLLVQLNDEDQQFSSLLETLIDYATDDSTHYRTCLLLLHKWWTHIDWALRESGSVEALHTALNKRGVTISLEQVKRWSRHQVRFPQNRAKVIQVIADIGKVNCTSADLNAIGNAQKTIKGLHGTMGKLLRKLLVAKRAGHDIQGNIGDDRIDADLLDSLVRVEEIVSVHRNERRTETLPKTSLAAILEEVVAASNGRVVATNGAIKSAQESPYEDLDRARACFELLANNYYWVYEKEKRLQLSEANAAAQPYRIEFKGDSSFKTMGKFKDEYTRTYKGVRVAIGKHLALGTAFDPKYCLRVYFHWDDEAQQLVIHHAGKHKTTARG